MKIAITGATGLVGSSLTDHLRRRGDTVARMVRSEADLQPGDILWSVDDQRLDPDDLAGTDVVVHLAGAPIGKRWTQEHKAEVLSSRRDGTRLLAEALAALDDGPEVLVSGSAVGYYGSRGDEVLTEESAPGADFLADVCVAWEEAADPARAAGLRVVHPRTGVVLAPEGPLVDKVELPFKLGVGGRVGDGQQWVPWVSLDDEVRALAFLVDTEVEGPANVTGPDPVRNARLTKALGAAWHRPTVLLVPIFAVRLLYGEMGVELATASQRVLPTVLLEHGFEFVHNDVETAAKAALR